MIFPIEHLMDEQKCYDWVVEFFPRRPTPLPKMGETPLPTAPEPSDSPSSKIGVTGVVHFLNHFTGTAFKATKWLCSKVVMILRGFLKGESMLGISKELKLSCHNLLYLWHRLMLNAHFKRDPTCLTENDEVFQNAGEKGISHPDKDDSPRCRAVPKKKRLGTYNNDRPPIYGTIGRESRQVRLELLHNATQSEVGLSLGSAQEQRGTCYSDESNA